MAEGRGALKGQSFAGAGPWSRRKRPSARSGSPRRRARRSTCPHSSERALVAEVCRARGGLRLTEVRFSICTWQRAVR